MAEQLKAGDTVMFRGAVTGETCVGVLTLREDGRWLVVHNVDGGTYVHIVTDEDLQPLPPRTEPALEAWLTS